MEARPYLAQSDWLAAGGADPHAASVSSKQAPSSLVIFGPFGLGKRAEAVAPDPF